MEKFLEKISRRFFWVLPARFAHSVQYRIERHKKLRLDGDGRDFNEKLQYLIVYKFGKKEGSLADKCLVKKYVEGLRIGGLEIPKTLKVYHDANDIKVDELPEKFVLKCNHSSGDVIICDDKRSFNLEKNKKILDRKLREKLARKTLEYHYNYIKPLIMAEEYLDDGTGKNPLDYKFYVFNGKCDRILVCSEREKS